MCDLMWLEFFGDIDRQVYVTSSGFDEDGELVKDILKLVSAIFLSNFYFFTNWQPFKNHEKCFLFH